MGENVVWVNISHGYGTTFSSGLDVDVFFMYLTAEFGACDHHQLHMAVLSIIVSRRNVAIR